jgi:hypothetical protein
VRCGAVRCGAVRCGAVRCGAVRCGAVRCGAVRCGAAPGVVPALRTDGRSKLGCSFCGLAEQLWGPDTFCLACGMNRMAGRPTAWHSDHKDPAGRTDVLGVHFGRPPSRFRPPGTFSGTQEIFTMEIPYSKDFSLGPR